MTQLNELIQDEQLYYWLLTLKDGETIKVKPELVDHFKAKIAANANILTKTRTIFYNEIRSFGVSEFPYFDPATLLEAPEENLAEDAARAFNEPIENTDGSIACKWVKRRVPSAKWTSYYSHISSYKFVSDDDSFVTMATFQPIHNIDYSKVQDVTQAEWDRLEHERNS